MALTLFEKLWQRHSVADLGEGFHLLFVDRHLLNDLAGRGFLTLNHRGLALRHPELTFATADHTVATLWNADVDPRGVHNDYVQNLRKNAAAHEFKLFDVGDANHGIVHIIAAEQGLALPGLTVACGDSHTCTLGGWERLPGASANRNWCRSLRHKRACSENRQPCASTSKDPCLTV